MLLEQLGLDRNSTGLACIGEKEDREDADWEQEDLELEQSRGFWGVAARVNFLSLDSLDLQFPIKQCSREMAKPVKGSCKRLKKVGRYLINRESVVRTYHWQDEHTFSYVATDSNWGGDRKDRKSTSGGIG